MRLTLIHPCIGRREHISHTTAARTAAGADFIFVHIIALHEPIERTHLIPQPQRAIINAQRVHARIPATGIGFASS